MRTHQRENVQFDVKVDVMSVLRFTDSDYPFGIFKLFLVIDLMTCSILICCVVLLKFKSFAPRLPVLF